MTRDRSAGCSRRLRSMLLSVADSALPAQDEPVVRVDEIAHSLETAFGEQTGHEAIDSGSREQGAANTRIQGDGETGEFRG
jgi:hypothetical protein